MNEFKHENKTIKTSKFLKFKEVTFFSALIYIFYFIYKD